MLFFNCKFDFSNQKRALCVRCSSLNSFWGTQSADFFPHVAITTNHILGGLNSNTHHSQLWKLGNSRAGCHGDSATVGPLSLACHSSFLAAPSLVEGWFTLKGESLHHRATTFMTTSKSNSARRPYLHVPSPCWNITDQLQSNTSMHPIILD